MATQRAAERAKQQERLNDAAGRAKQLIEDLAGAEQYPLVQQASGLLRLLMQAGAAAPFAPQQAGAGLDLSGLAVLDTPNTRELLELLERAQVVAERVDKERGRSMSPEVPLLPGESRGTDLAEAVSLMALRVRGEVFGAKGRE